MKKTGCPRSPYSILSLDEQKVKYARDDHKISPFELGIPLIDLSDETIKEIYYFRWHTYCKHIKRTPRGRVVTEFLPDVPWAGKYNTINCPAGHHFYEGRWLHKGDFLDEYARFWFTEDGSPRKYSFWAADAIYAMCKARGNMTLAESLLEALIENYVAWEKEKLTESGMFWQRDNRDGMEYSISGDGCRPTINSYMYGDAVAISEIAEGLGRHDIARLYRDKAQALREKINTLLWDNEAEFYKTRKKDGDFTMIDVREEIGYVPWYFNVPENNMSTAWKFLNDERYFKAPYGPTTAEQCHPDFMKPFDHECLWNGPSWPFATSQTLTALGNLLCNYKQDVMTEADYFELLKTYANSHFLTTENGEKIPFIDENLDPYTGEWLARSILRSIKPPRKDIDRGIDYNHSSYCDLVISGLAGIRTDRGKRLTVHPLFSSEQLAYFCADGILYHGHSITVLWDKTGKRYNRGVGLQILCDGRVVAKKDELSEIKIDL